VRKCSVFFSPVVLFCMSYDSAYHDELDREFRGDNCYQLYGSDSTALPLRGGGPRPTTVSPEQHFLYNQAGIPNELVPERRPIESINARMQRIKPAPSQPTGLASLMKSGCEAFAVVPAAGALTISYEFVVALVFIILIVMCCINCHLLCQILRELRASRVERSSAPLGAGGL
jgi:hypothetical protein